MNYFHNRIVTLYKPVLAYCAYCIRRGYCLVNYFLHILGTMAYNSFCSVEESSLTTGLDRGPADSQGVIAGIITIIDYNAIVKTINNP